MGFYIVNVLLCIFSLGFFYWMQEVVHTSIKMGDDVLPTFRLPEENRGHSFRVCIFFLLLENAEKKNQFS